MSLTPVTKIDEFWALVSRQRPSFTDVSLELARDVVVATTLPWESLTQPPGFKLGHPALDAIQIDAQRLAKILSGLSSHNPSEIVNALLGESPRHPGCYVNAKGSVLSIHLNKEDVYRLHSAGRIPLTLAGFISAEHLSALDIPLPFLSIINRGGGFYGPSALQVASTERHELLHSAFSYLYPQQLLHARMFHKLIGELLDAALTVDHALATLRSLETATRFCTGDELVASFGTYFTVSCDKFINAVQEFARKARGSESFQNFSGGDRTLIFDALNQMCQDLRADYCAYEEFARGLRAAGGIEERALDHAISAPANRAVYDEVAASLLANPFPGITSPRL